MAMVRKQLYLPANVDRELMAEAKRRGISQAELIRMRIEGRDGMPGRARTPVDDRRRQEALQALRKVYDTAKEGPGTGWKFKREELYAERIDKARPR